MGREGGGGMEKRNMSQLRPEWIQRPIAEKRKTPEEKIEKKNTKQT